METIAGRRNFGVGTDFFHDIKGNRVDIARLRVSNGIKINTDQIVSCGDCKCDSVVSASVCCNVKGCPSAGIG